MREGLGPVGDTGGTTKAGMGINGEPMGDSERLNEEGPKGDVLLVKK